MAWKVRLLTVLIFVFGAASAAETVTVGAEDDWYPFSGVVKGKTQGMTVDIIRAAFDAVGVAVNFESMPYSRCMALTRRGRLMAYFDSFRTPATESDFLWHSPSLFRVEYLIYAPADSKRQHLGVPDLEGHHVAVSRGYEYGKAFDSDVKIEREISSHDESNFRMLLAGRVDYTVTAEIIANLLFKEHPELAGKFKPVGSVSRNDVYMAFSRSYPDSPHQVERFERGLKIINKNGRLHAIEQHWLQGSMLN